METMMRAATIGGALSILFLIGAMLLILVAAYFFRRGRSLLTVLWVSYLLLTYVQPQAALVKMWPEFNPDSTSTLLVSLRTMVLALFMVTVVWFLPKWFRLTARIAVDQYLLEREKIHD